MRAAQGLCLLPFLAAGCNAIFGVDQLGFDGAAGSAPVGAAGAGNQGGVGTGGATAGADPGGAGGTGGGEGAAGGSGGSTTPWWDDGFSQRVRISFQSLGSETSADDFPVAVRLDGAQIDLDVVASDAADIRFVDPDGELLAHELDHWSDQGGAAWVLVPELDAASGDDHMWLYYGNPAATTPTTSPWPAHFVTVHHWSGQDEGADPDSAGELALQPHGGATAGEGVVGNGLALDGDGDYGTLEDDPLLGTVDGDQRTLSMWFHAAATSSGQPLWIRELGCAGWTLGINAQGTLDGSLRTSTGNCNGHVHHNVATEGIDVRDGDWHHVGFVVDRVSNAVSLYFDGSLVGTNPITDTAPSNLGQAYLGTNPWTPTHCLDGALDELRVSSAAPGPSWHFLEHANGRGQLLSYGAVEKQ